MPRFFRIARSELRKATVGLILFFAVAATSSLRAALTWSTTTFEQTAAIGDTGTRTSFRFKNSGEQPVTISSVETSCGCTVALLDQKTYAPGESGEIKVTYNFAGQVGRQEKTVTVTTTDASAPSTVLTLRVTIPEPYTVSPRLVIWPVHEIPEGKSVTIHVDPALHAELSLPLPLPAQLSARLVAGANQDTYLLWLKPTSTQTPFQATVTLQLERANVPALPIAIYARVR